MNKSNINKVINKMKMFLPLSMLWIGAVTSDDLIDPLQSELTTASLNKKEKAQSFFSFLDIFSICCQPTTGKDDLDDKIEKELPLVNPLEHLRNLLEQNELGRFFRQSESGEGNGGL